MKCVTLICAAVVVLVGQRCAVGEKTVDSGERDWTPLVSTGAIGLRSVGRRLRLGRMSSSTPPYGYKPQVSFMRSRGRLLPGRRKNLIWRCGTRRGRRRLSSLRKATIRICRRR